MTEPRSAGKEPTVQASRPSAEHRGTTSREAGPAEATRPRRRQARGERRITQLLDTAAEVFATVGFTAAGTNQIARAAGVSPGTLYQYFPNKEAIAVELGRRLSDRLRHLHAEALDAVHPGMALDEVLDVVLDPLIDFNCRNPSVLALIHSSDVPGRFAEEHDRLHAYLLTRVESLIGDFCPVLTEAERTRTAEMSFALVKGGLALVMAHQGGERDAYVTELKAALYRYLAPLTATRT